MNIAYLRCSKDIQDTEHQERSIKEYCERNQLIIDKTIKDEGVSAYSKSATDRDGFQEILHLSHLGQIEHLIVFESSRISRRFIEGQTLIDTLTKNGVIVHSVMDNAIINQNELDQLFNSFKFFMNQKSSRETSERIKSSKKLAKEQGKWLGGKILFGFKVVDGYEIIDEELRASVNDLFDTYISQGSKEVMTKYNIKSHQILLQKLKNPKYINIIGQAKFNQTQKVILSRATSKKGNKTKTNKTDIIYEGLLYHSCGNKLSIDRGRKGEVRFRCKKCKGNPEITSKKSFVGIQLMNNIDREVKEAINILDKDKLEQIYQSKSTKNKSITEYKIKELTNSLNERKRVLKNTNDKLENLLLNDASENLLNVLADKITSTKKEIDKLEHELSEKKAELSNIDLEDKVQNELINKLTEIKKVYEQSNNIKKRAILHVLIEKIVVYDIDEFKIYMRLMQDETHSRNSEIALEPYCDYLILVV